MKNIISSKIILPALLFFPFAAFAQTSLSSLITKWTSAITLIINFLMVVATLIFIWGIVRYISAGGDAAKVKEARSYIVWGLIGLAIMGSVWVIVRLVQLEVVGTDTPETAPFPKYNIR